MLKKILPPLSLIGTIAMLVVMAKTGASLKTKEAPLGILNLELTFKKPLADSVLTSWKNTASLSGVNNIEVAKVNTYWDFLFILFYSLFLFLACNKVAAYFTGGYSNWGMKLGYAAFIVAALDIIENAGMLMMLNGNSGSFIVLFTSIISAVKWLLVIIILLYIILSTPLALYSKIR